ncbi:hypothetical protein KKA14_17800 [bacterium]|nr:hypothetical protein [bacterium]
MKQFKILIHFLLMLSIFLMSSQAAIREESIDTTDLSSEMLSKIQSNGLDDLQAGEQDKDDIDFEDESTLSIEVSSFEEKKTDRIIILRISRVSFKIQVQIDDVPGGHSISEGGHEVNNYERHSFHAFGEIPRNYGPLPIFGGSNQSTYGYIPSIEIQQPVTYFENSDIGYYSSIGIDYGRFKSYDEGPSTNEIGLWRNNGDYANTEKVSQEIYITKNWIRRYSDDISLFTTAGLGMALLHIEARMTTAICEGENWTEIRKIDRFTAAYTASGLITFTYRNKFELGIAFYSVVGLKTDIYDITFAKHGMFIGYRF